MSKQKMSRLLLCDGPPHAGSGGCHRLAWLFAQRTRGTWSGLLTRRFYRANPPDWRSNHGIPNEFVGPDENSISSILPSALRYILGLCGWMYFLIANRKRLLDGSPETVFAFFGADSFFIPRVWLVSMILQLPVEVYLVDDLDDWARIHGSKSRLFFNRCFQRTFLKNVSVVYCISPGFVEEVRDRFGVSAHWLPIALPMELRAFRVAEARQSKRICHIGSVNRLYSGALIEFVDALDAVDQSKKFTLDLITSQSVESIPDRLSKNPRVRIVSGLQGEALVDYLSESAFVLLVYSFTSDVERMVRTSFPTKVTEALTCGRPLFVYAPEYSSLARFLTDSGFGEDFAGQNSLHEFLGLALTGVFSLGEFKIASLRANLEPVSHLI